MAVLYTPTDKGFDARLEAIDRCQVGLLRELAAEGGTRLVLKGGMAMRAVFGSLRLTKDIDFDRMPSLSQRALRGSLVKQLQRAAAAAGIRRPQAEITKDTSTTVRARLQGLGDGGIDLRFEVEVSGRLAPDAALIRSELVRPPPRYGMAPFMVTTYCNEALVVMKIAAALSQQRHAPRDLYDLRDLLRAGTDPVDLLARQPADWLMHCRDGALDKLSLLTHQLAEQELLPYLPQSERDSLTEEAWLETTLHVAQAIHDSCNAALVRQHSPAKAPPP